MSSYKILEFPGGRTDFDYQFGNEILILFMYLGLSHNNLTSLLYLPHLVWLRAFISVLAQPIYAWISVFWLSFLERAHFVIFAMCATGPCPSAAPSLSPSKAPYFSSSSVLPSNHSLNLVNRSSSSRFPHSRTHELLWVFLPSLWKMGRHQEKRTDQPEVNIIVGYS